MSTKEQEQKHGMSDAASLRRIPSEQDVNEATRATLTLWYGGNGKRFNVSKDQALAVLSPAPASEAVWDECVEACEKLLNERAEHWQKLKQTDRCLEAAASGVALRSLKRKGEG